MPNQAKAKSNERSEPQRGSGQKILTLKKSKKS